MQACQAEGQKIAAFGARQGVKLIENYGAQIAKEMAGFRIAEARERVVPALSALCRAAYYAGAGALRPRCRPERVFDRYIKIHFSYRRGQVSGDVDGESLEG